VAIEFLLDYGIYFNNKFNLSLILKMWEKSLNNGKGNGCYFMISK
jgi:hypothetical protein